LFESLFQFLFEYRPHVFRQAEFRFSPPAGVSFVAVAIIAALAIAFVSYRVFSTNARWRQRAVLAALRLVVLALILFCLFRPVLVVKAAVSQQNVVGVLIDDSRSMQIGDAGGTRADFARRTFADPASPTLKALSDRFLIRTFRFSSSTARVNGPNDLTFAGTQTRLASAIQNARQQLAGLPLSGLVLVTDGADTTTDASVADALLSSKADAVPIFTVGVGQETLARDIQIGRVSTPRTALKGTSLLVDAIVTQTGYAGQTVTLDVEDAGKIVGSQPVRLPADGDPAAVRVRFTATEAGPRLFHLRIAPQPGEVVTENNQRDVQIDVRDRRERILYFEGEPRFEMSFMRRAIASDQNLQLVTLQRTAENKYYRLDVDPNGVELAQGFPRTREELFAYRGIILGSVEAAAFTGDQLRMISEFVDVRGGGLLLLGGPHAFAEGGYAGTAVADVMPVTLERPSRGTEAAHVKVKPTRAGEAQAVTQLGDTEEASAERWKTLPPLTVLNMVQSVKPGATVLLSGTDERRRDRVVLAFERYGRGKSIAFPVHDSWLWQMHSSIRVDDQTHENFWRQMLRWLVDGVPDAVDAKTLTDRVEPGQSVTVTADVVDPRFVELNDADVTAHVASPSGKTIDVPLEWTGERNGQYRATFTTDQAGWYEAKIDASRSGKPIGTAVTHVRAAPDDAEYFDAAMHASLLQRIAQETGGRFYKADGISSLAEDVKYSGRGVTTVEERELWHMPILLLALLTALCAEWALRRHWRMA
jgi:uncharacterized membrane protein